MLDVNYTGHRVNLELKNNTDSGGGTYLHFLPYGPSLHYPFVEQYPRSVGGVDTVLTSISPRKKQPD